MMTNPVMPVASPTVEPGPVAADPGLPPGAWNTAPTFSVRLHIAGVAERLRLSITDMALAVKVMPHIVVTDIEMPEMDGYELIARLEADPALRPTAASMATFQPAR